MSTTEHESTEKAARHPLTKPSVILSALFLGLVAAGGTWVGFATSPEDREGGFGPVCERPASTDTGFSGALPVESWVLHGAARLPDTPFGADRTMDGVPTCYEQSPGGAAVAAINISTLGSNGATEEALKHLAVDSEAADAALAGTPEHEPVPETPIVADGFRIADYTGDTASVIVVMDTPGGYRALTIDLLWEDDWKWDVPTESLDVTPVYSLNGYNTLSTPQEETNG